ncbi:MAG: C-3',4' desaturase CrtD, partial [Cyanobacteria bacterium P01_F01_bin.42]
VSVSRPGDGRAPDGHATIIASSFTDPQRWNASYSEVKAEYSRVARERLGQYFNLDPSLIVHEEAGTPKTFARFTGRAQGIVGGLGQRRLSFGPFGFSTRSPLKNLWLVGDSTHPGEGTAGVSYSAWSATRQIEAALSA